MTEKGQDQPEGVPVRGRRGQYAGDVKQSPSCVTGQNTCPVQKLSSATGISKGGLETVTIVQRVSPGAKQRGIEVLSSTEIGGRRTCADSILQREGDTEQTTARSCSESLSYTKRSFSRVNASRNAHYCCKQRPRGPSASTGASKLQDSIETKRPARENKSILRSEACQPCDQF